MKDTKFDYIICGAGCAGLSVADRLCAPAFRDKKILLIDRDPKLSNDRTWSFWARADEHRYAGIYAKQWSKLAFYAPSMEQINHPAEYTYQTIRGEDFYDHVRAQIDQCDHITWIQADVIDIIESVDHIEVHTDQGNYTGSYTLDSIVKRMPTDNKLFVWQHFLGWEVEMQEDTFDDGVATFMDFRVPQDGETQFVYVLPFNKKRALIESTFFSKEVYPEARYEEILSKYMEQYYPGRYEIAEKEIGKIPMTTAPFSQGSPRVIPIGTNNATVKPSSGYAFMRIQKEADQIAKMIAKNQLKRVKHPRKYVAYDRTLLNVLTTGKEPGRKVFRMMFERNAIDQNLKFLSEDTSLLEEMKIFSTLPFWSFTRAFFEENIVGRSK